MQTTDTNSSQPESTPKSRSVLPIAANLLMVVVLVVLGFLVWQRFINKTTKSVSAQEAASQSSASESNTEVNQADASAVAIEYPDVAMNPINPSSASDLQGILRMTNYHTIIPSRPRQDVITYTVQRNDTLFGIAEQFNVKPETVLWGNFDTLQDNPHLLKPDQVLNILPVDGTYYRWQSGDNLGAVASFFGVDPEAILEYPGNNVDLTAVDSASAGVESGKWLIVPGGQREIKDWGPPAISRSNPAVARYYGDGACGSIVEGAMGSGTFVWPTSTQSISGYNYSGIHPAIDFAGAVGNPVVASDSGVVVFAGWSNYGYGYMVVLDHGNGFQTAYAHLSAVAVTCGQSVYQGGYIGAVGSTGNSSGAHLHFELSYNGAKLNPLEYLY